MNRNNLRIGVTWGMRGYFAVLYDSDGPVQTGFGSHKTWKAAAREAKQWAAAEELPLDFEGEAV